MEGKLAIKSWTVWVNVAAFLLVLVQMDQFKVALLSITDLLNALGVDVTQASVLAALGGCYRYP